MLDNEDVKYILYAILVLFGLIVLLLFWLLCLGIIIFRHNSFLLTAWIVVTVMIVGACMD